MSECVAVYDACTDECGRLPLVFFAAGRSEKPSFQLLLRVMQETVSGYDAESITVGVLGSHSAIDVLDGAAQESLSSLVVLQKGRDAVYSKYLRKIGVTGGKARRGKQ